MALGARRKFGAPVFELEVFMKQMSCIEESACDIVRTFGASCSHSAPHSDSGLGELFSPCPSRHAPDADALRSSFKYAYYLTNVSKMIR